MYKNRRIIAIAPAYNEEVKIGTVVRRCQLDFIDAVLLVDDGSTDRTANVAKDHGAKVISLTKRQGVGAAIRAGLDHAREQQFDIAIILAGNNKDNPAEIPSLLDPICEQKCDLVVGSRYMAGGCLGGDMPFYRKLATRVHPWLMSWFVGKRLTESTNGFRAIRLAALEDPRINLHQSWLDAYGLEVYLLWKMLKLGCQHAEVPCTKIYPSRKHGYTKMTPITGWWNILRPIFLLGLGLRR